MPDPFDSLKRTVDRALSRIDGVQEHCNEFIDNSALDADHFNPSWQDIIKAAEAAGLAKAVDLLEEQGTDTPPDHVAQVRDTDVIELVKNEPENTIIAWGMDEDCYNALHEWVEYQREMVAAAINVYADAINAGLFAQTKPAEDSEQTTPASETNSDWDDVMQSFHSDAYIKESE